MTELIVKNLTGEQIHPYLDELARLRIEVFREYPYLYDGSLDYETEYLTSYAACPESLVVGAFKEDRLVGASTGLPMKDAADEFKAPFQAQGQDIDKIFYFGESVMEKSCRGTGIYARFFEERKDMPGLWAGLTGSASVRWSARRIIRLDQKNTVPWTTTGTDADIPGIRSWPPGSCGRIWMKRKKLPKKWFSGPNRYKTGIMLDCFFVMV